MKKLLLLALCQLLILNPLMSNIAYAKGPYKSKSLKRNKKYDLRQLALPSEVQKIRKGQGAVYYSPVVKGKVLIPVHIWGEVQKAGLHFVPVDTTLIEGLSFAGGLNNQGRLDNIKVTRRTETKNLVVKAFNLSKGGDQKAYDFRLTPGDTIFIERSTYYVNRAYYTSLIGLAATVLSTLVLVYQIKKR